MTEIGFKPCPFCGGDNIRLDHVALLRDPPLILYSISCRKCEATVGKNFISEEAAIKAWNRREKDGSATEHA